MWRPEPVLRRPAAQTAALSGVYALTGLSPAPRDRV